MFDAALSTGDVAPSLSEARRCLASSLREVEELSRLLLGAGDAKAALTVAKDMRACSEQLVRGIAASGELLRSDELVGANREQLRAGLGAGIVSRSGVVADTFGDEFRAEFKDADDIARRRVSELLWRREVGLRPYPRFHTNLHTIVRESGQAKSEGCITNISRSGAFVTLGALPRQGSVVELDISLPEHAGYHTVHAYVIHVAPRRGVGVQFIGGGDAFGSDLDRYLEQLGR